MPTRSSPCATAAAQGADLVMTPELQLTGYPAEDLVLKPEFVRRTIEATERLVDATADGGPACCSARCIGRGRRALQCDGACRGRARSSARTLKHELPNYGTFDEKRIFATGPLPRADRVARGQARRADLRGHLAPAVCAALRDAGADLLLVPNGSPFEYRQGRPAPGDCPRPRRPRPACRSPSSTASAGRTRSCSTAPASSSTTMASWSSR